MNATSVLYTIHVVRKPANASLAVALPVAFVVLQFALVSVIVNVGAVLSIVNAAVSEALFNPALSVTVTLIFAVARFATGVVQR